MNKETPFDDIFNRLCRHLKETESIDIISKDFMRLGDDFQRIQFLLDLKSVRDIVQIPEELIKNVADLKSVHKSIELRDEGNRLFRESNYEEAIMKYTQSLSHAPVGVNENKRYNVERDTNGSSSCLTCNDNYNVDRSSLSPNIETKFSSISVAHCAALAYANRSAVLFHLGQYSSCLDDIQAALIHEYPAKMWYKLEERQARCHIALNNANAAIKFLDAAATSLQFSDLNEKKRIQFQKELDRNIVLCKDISSSPKKTDVQNQSNVTNDINADGTLEECNDSHRENSSNNIPQFSDASNCMYPSLSSSADVTSANGRGRFIVATRDIFPGDVILVERPYASVLLPERYYDHCRRCYRQTFTLVPCDYCASALYCCEDCRSSDLDVHSRECRGDVPEILRLSGVDKFAFLAVRTIATMSLDSLDEFRSILIAKKLSKMQTNIVEDSSKIALEVYKSSDYDAICQLVTNAEERSAHDLFRRGIIAVYLLRGLERAGYFHFKLNSSRPYDPTLQVFTAGLLLSHLQSFPCNAHEISEFVLDRSSIATSEPRELGAGIYATLSLFNHSCDPAVTRSFFGDTCVVRAIRSVSAGEELSDNYGAVYALQTRQERCEKLAPQYYFQCCCDACLGDWPLFSIAQSLPPIWRCSVCHISPLASDGVCMGCGVSQSLTENLERLKKSHAKYTTAFQLLLAGDANASLPILLDHLRVINELCCRPWAEYSSCQEAIKQCFSILSNCCVVVSKAK